MNSPLNWISIPTEKYQTFLSRNTTFYVCPKDGANYLFLILFTRIQTKLLLQRFSIVLLAFNLTIQKILSWNKNSVKFWMLRVALLEQHKPFSEK